MSGKYKLSELFVDYQYVGAMMTIDDEVCDNYKNTNKQSLNRVRSL